MFNSSLAWYNQRKGRVCHTSSDMLNVLVLFDACSDSAVWLSAAGLLVGGVLGCFIIASMWHKTRKQTKVIQKDCNYRQNMVNAEEKKKVDMIRVLLELIQHNKSLLMKLVEWNKLHTRIISWSKPTRTGRDRRMRHRGWICHPTGERWRHGCWCRLKWIKHTNIKIKG